MIGGALRVTLTAGNEFIGGQGHTDLTMDFEIWVHPDPFPVSLQGSAEWETLDLVEPWR